MALKMRIPTGLLVVGLSLVNGACGTTGPDTQSQKPARLSKTAGTLYQANHIEAICAKKDDSSMSWCMGFIAGVADAAQEAANASGTCVFKLPRTIEGFGLRATVLTDLEFHPSPVERSGAEAVVAALQRSHPC